MIRDRSNTGLKRIPWSEFLAKEILTNTLFCHYQNVIVNTYSNLMSTSEF